MATFTIGSRTRTTTTQRTTSTIEAQEDDAEKKPSEEKDDFWIVEHPREDNIDVGGKWMLFYLNSAIDSAWVRAKRLFREGSLTGISCMKVSTARGNPRATSSSTKVIIFYCGPPHDEENVLKYGHNLVDMMEYRSSNPYIYYKSDEQTLQGTRSTGQTKNHLYRITIPKMGAEGVATNKINGKRKSDHSGSSQERKKATCEAFSGNGVSNAGGSVSDGEGSCSAVSSGREAFLRRIECDIAKNKKETKDSSTHLDNYAPKLLNAERVNNQDN